VTEQLRASSYRLHWALRSRAAPLGKFGHLGLVAGIQLLTESQYWSRERLDQLRDEKLRRLVVHAYAHVPYYRRLMDEAGVRPIAIQGLADLHKLPILTKDILREKGAEMCADDLGPDQVEIGITGGTTGNPMRVMRDRASTVWQRASYWRGFSWGGLRLGDSWVQVFGGSLGLTPTSRKERWKNWFSGKTFLPAFELGAHNVDRYVETIRQSGARFLVGYASACYFLAQHLERTGKRLHLQAVFPTAELLPESWAETIARVFSARVLPYYGCGEVQSLGYACPEATAFTRPSNYHAVYHSCDEHAVIEVEHPERGATLTGEGEFLITDLDNVAMPLIRYRNGDAGIIAEPGCGCGRSLGRILRLDGRVSDVLITERGDAISGTIGAHCFRFVNNVAQFQIVQRRPAQVVLRVVPTGAYDARVEEPTLRAVFTKHLGPSADIRIEYVASIPRTRAGKARLVINEYLEAVAAAVNRPGLGAGTPPDHARGRMQ
jgi:phenylacetate-CoA ligase